MAVSLKLDDTQQGKCEKKNTSPHMTCENTFNQAYSVGSHVTEPCLSRSHVWFDGERLKCIRSQPWAREDDLRNKIISDLLSKKKHDEEFYFYMVRKTYGGCIVVVATATIHKRIAAELYNCGKYSCIPSFLRINVHQPFQPCQIWRQ